jgi:hypothetical protein
MQTWKLIKYHSVYYEKKYYQIYLVYRNYMKILHINKYNEAVTVILLHDTPHHLDSIIYKCHMYDNII